MCIKKYLILALSMIFGVTPMSTHAVKSKILRSNPAGMSEQQREVDLEKDEPAKKRMRNSKYSEKTKSGEQEGVSPYSEREYLDQKTDSEDDADQSSADDARPKDDTDKLSSDDEEFGEDEKSEPELCAVGLTPNGREIVRSLHSGFGLDLNILVRPSADDFIKRLKEVYECVKKEPALCVAPMGEALIIGNLHGDIAKTRESILAARIAFETDKAKSIVFLGNFADKGSCCIETLDEIFKFKLEFPNKVFLVSGSSEAKSLIKLEELMLDMRQKFSKEDFETVKQTINFLFRQLPIMVEVPLVTGEKVLCLYGNIPRFKHLSSNEVVLGRWVKQNIDAVKKLNLEYFYTGANSMIFRSILGLNESAAMDEVNVDLFLKLAGYKYLVKCCEISEDDLVEKFDGKCWVLNNSMCKLTEDGVYLLGEEPNGEVKSVKEWNLCEVSDFVRDADTSDPDVLASLGILAKCDGDFDLAREYYEEAVEKGSAVAQYELGSCYENGQGVSQSYAKAAKLYDLAAKQGIVKAICDLGYCYREGKGVKKNVGKAMRLIQQAADQGLSTAHYILGDCYEMGCGAQRDLSQSIMWYKKAAEQNHAFAQCKLGCIYMSGQEMEKDCDEAMKWFNLAADNGNAIAQFNMGVFYKEGVNVSIDPQKAAEYFSLAAEQDCVNAQCELGFCYEYGVGMPRDIVKAIEYYKKAADQGFVTAQQNLGMCYFEGKGVEQDFDEAIKLFLLAAEQGNVNSQFSLGACYEQGQGVKRNYKEAMKWYRKAAANGDVQAKHRLIELSYLLRQK